MYDELVKRLRKESGEWCANCFYKCGDNVCGAPDDRKKDCDVYTKLHAADAIEERERLIDAQLAIIKQYQEYLSKPPWIPASERLPVSGVPTLICGDGNVVEQGFFDDEFGYWYDSRGIRIFVHHWMPMPHPPKEGE